MAEDRPTPQEKIDVAPWLAAGALIVAVVAIVVAIVALGKDEGDTSSGAAAAGGHAAGAPAEHAAPVPIEGIEDAQSDRGGTQLEGERRNGAIEFELEARPVWWRVLPDQRLAAYAYNGIVPGPEFRVPNGERVRIHYTNNLPVETTVHWHGIGVPNDADGVPEVTQPPVEPGGSYTYEFSARPAGEPQSGGTFIYHSHVDEEMQMGVGLSGTFIIEPPEPGPVYAVEKTVFLSEWTADAASGRTRGVMPAEGNFPNFFTINGKSYPATAQIELPRGEPALLRVVNAGQFEHPMHIHGTAFRIVGHDGHPVREPGLRDTVTLSSGERADIAFEIDEPGKWIFHCHIGHHQTNNGEGPGGLITVIEVS